MKCRECGKKISTYARECPYCHTVVSQTNDEVEIYLAQLNHLEEKADLKKKRKIRRKTPLQVTRRTYYAVACVLITVVVSGVAYGNKKTEWKLSKNNATYITENGIVSQNINSGKKNQISRILNEESENKRDTVVFLSYGYHESSQKNCIYYVDFKEDHGDDASEIQLFRKNADNIHATPECIADSVFFLDYDGKDNVYYTDRAMKVLTRYDGLEKKEMNLNNISAIDYAKNMDVILVTTREDLGVEDGIEKTQFVMNEVDPTSFTQKELFRISSPRYEISEKEHCIYYMRDNVLYSYDYQSRKEKKIESSVDGFVLEKDGEEEYLYYNRYSIGSVSCYDLVIDEYATKDKQSNWKSKNAKNREKLRNKLKKEPFHIINTELYCYHNGTSAQIGYDVENLDDKVLDGQGYYRVPTCSQMIEIEKEYEMSEGGYETVDSVKEYFTGVEGRQSSQNINSRMYSDSYIDSKGKLKNAEILAYYCVSDDEEQIILYQGAMIRKEDDEDAYYAALDERYSKSNEDASYHYNVKEECFKFKEQSNKEETELLGVCSYQLLDSGEALILMENDTNSRDLYIIDKSGKKRLLAKNVLKLLGENICLVREETDLWY